MKKLPVNEYFVTIQGEATFTGRPSLFVRLQGCPVGCPWCDTKHTWHMDNEQLDVFAKMTESDSYAYMSPAEIMALVESSQVDHVVITGGEPCLYDLTAITGMIIDSGRTVQIETSGTHTIRCHPSTWVTVSPKYNMPNGLEVLSEAMCRADEIKLPVGKQKDIEKALSLRMTHDVPVWLQPLSQSEKATEVAVRAAIIHGLYLSVQTHKYIGVR